MNKVILIGFMCENPKQSVSQKGTPITKFRINVKRAFATNGQKYSYYNCVAYKQTADYVYKYCNSQSKICIEGALDNYSYTGKDGQKRYVTEIICSQVEIISSTVNKGDYMEKQKEAEPEYTSDETAGDDDELPFL